MSRIGKKPVAIPQGVKVTFENNVISVEGSKGKLVQEVSEGISVNLEEGQLVVLRSSETKDQRSKHGLYRSLVNNMIIGVSEGYKKELSLVGVGYKATCSNNVLELNLGYSHDIFFVLPAEVTGVAVMEKGKDPKITLESFDKQLLGQVCAKLRSLRKIEPYKGKGVRFVGEVIRRKAGKTASK